MASVNPTSQDTTPQPEDTASQVDANLVSQRRRELIRVYADPIRTTIAYKLLYRYGCTDLTKEELDEHAKNVVILVLKSVDVTTDWPPSTETDSQVERILQDYLDKFFLKASEEERVPGLERSQLHHEEGLRFSSETVEEVLEVMMNAPQVDRTLYLLSLSFDLTYKQLADIASRATGKQMSQEGVMNRIYQVQDQIWNRLHRDDTSSKENS